MVRSKLDCNIFNVDETREKIDFWFCAIGVTQGKFDANSDDNVHNDNVDCNFLQPTNLKPIKPSSTSKLGLLIHIHTLTITFKPIFTLILRHL